MKLGLRYYQREAIETAYDFLRKHKKNPCIVLPTGAGKTPVMASICNDVVARWSGRVLILSHVKELIKQTAETLHEWHPELDVGVYSAGLNRRDKKSDVLVAGIQSVHAKGLELTGDRPFNIVLVDEAHRIPTSGDGMYRRLLTDLGIASPTIRVIGLTATPYRLKGGYVCGDDHFLNEVCYEAGIKELIAKNYLCPLISKQSKSSIDSSELKIKNGEFDNKGMSDIYDTDEKVSLACREIADLTRDRKSVLLFCCNVAHAEHVQESIIKLTGCECGLVTGESSKEHRDKTIREFKEGRLKYLVNVNVLTEGFDAKQVDCVSIIRATLSPGLYYQMVGRGLRIHPDKQNCLILDFGGNIKRHGCIDNIQVNCDPGGTGVAPERQCPNCDTVMPSSYTHCRDCGFQFEVEEKKPNHEHAADTSAITTDQIPSTTFEVTDVSYAIHVKRGFETGPKTLRVSYYEGMIAVADEWVCLEHTGFAYEKARKWWALRCKAPMPETVKEAAMLGTRGFLAEPTSISTMRPPGERFDRIVNYELGEVPEFDEEELKADAF